MHGLMKEEQEMIAKILEEKFSEDMYKNKKTNSA